MTLRFTFRSCKDTCEDFAKMISNSYQNNIKHAINTDQYDFDIEIRSSGDKERDNLLLKALKEIDGEAFRVAIITD